MLLPHHRRSYARVLVLLPLFLVACGGSDDEEGSDNPAEDVTAPITNASPPGGAYRAAQTVKLTSNEAATIYYTLDGSVPAIGAPNTQSGPSPVQGLAVSTSPMQIKFFGVDAAGNVEIVRTHDYVIDTVVPVVTTVGPAPEPFGVLTQHTFTWQSSEFGQYVIQLGGNGAPGSGLQLEAGIVAANTQKTIVVNGWQLPLGAVTPFTVFVTDTATNVGSAIVDLESKEPAFMPLTPNTTGMAVAPDGASVFFSWFDAHEVAQYDVDPTSRDYGEQIGGISVGMQPGDLAITPDGTRLYVGHASGLDEIETGSQGVETLQVPGVDRIVDVAVTADGKRAYVARSGILFVVDIDPTSKQFHVVDTAVSTTPLFTSAFLAASPNGKHLLVAWMGQNVQSLAVVDIDPASPTFHLVIATLVPPTTGFPVAPSVSFDGSYGYAGTANGSLARVNFELSPIAIDRTNALLTPTCILVTPDDEHLLIVKHHSFGLWLAEPESLANAGGIFWVAMGRVGAISPDGTIAYLLYDSASTSQRLVALPLE